MGFSQENGYTPETIEDLMDWLMTKINELFSTSYNTARFQGTNWYKMSYAWAQRMQQSEVKTSEIFLKLQQYITVISEKISRPVNTYPGIIDKMASEGYVASIKPISDADKGKIFICVDADNTAPDWATVKSAIALLISQITVGGTVTQGPQTENVVISNGQSFPISFYLPNKHTTFLRLTLAESENNKLFVPDDETIRLALLAKIASIYKLGKNFEPDIYFNLDDAPWAGAIKLEWSIDSGSTWSTSIYDAAFDDLLVLSAANTQVIIN